MLILTPFYRRPSICDLPVGKKPWLTFHNTPDLHRRYIQFVSWSRHPPSASFKREFHFCSSLNIAPCSLCCPAKLEFVTRDWKIGPKLFTINYEDLCYGIIKVSNYEMMDRGLMLISLAFGSTERHILRVQEVTRVRSWPISYMWSRG
jgi:hypothetical protein